MIAGSVTGLHRSAGGVPKLPVPEAEVTVAGLAGDRQRNLRFHGGPDRAVCLLAQEVIDALAAEGHPIRPGSTGENITIAGLDWAAIAPGDRLELGGHVLLEITSHTTPCRNISGSFRDGDFSRLGHRRHPGRTRWYARVLVPGRVALGDVVVVAPRSG
jgi:MOSC domain-containing protein YiiM